MALGRLRPKHAALVEALNGRFDDHHAELAGCCLTRSTLTDQISAQPAASRTHRRAARRRTEPPTDPSADRRAAVSASSSGSMRSPVSAGCRPHDHRRDRSRHAPVPHRRTPRLVGQADPRTIQSGPRTRLADRQRQPLPQRRAWKQAAAGGPTRSWVSAIGAWSAAEASSEPSSLARSILVIVWHLLADPAARFTDSGPTTTPTASTRPPHPPPRPPAAALDTKSPPHPPPDPP